MGTFLFFIISLFSEFRLGVLILTKGQILLKFSLVLVYILNKKVVCVYPEIYNVINAKIYTDLDFFQTYGNSHRKFLRKDSPNG